MANLPPVKLETHTTWFNLLLTLLREHAQNNPYEEYRQMAQRLFSKCMAYGTPFTDGYGASCVDLRLYPSEAVVTAGGQSSKAMADQIMAADKSRLKTRLDTLSRADMLAIEDAIKVHLAFSR